MRIGIFGGTFDPPHLGHLALAAEAAYQLRLGRVLWVLTPDPPHKQDHKITPAAARLELLAAAVMGNPLFQVSQVDLERPGPHYAVDTVRLLRDQYPGDDLFYLVGADSLRDLPKWHRPRELIQQVAGLGVMQRPGVSVDLAALEAFLPGIAQKVQWILCPQLAISASAIRERIAAGRPFRYFLTPPVYELICSQRYYHASPGPLAEN